VKNERIPLENFYSGCCGEEVFRKIYAAYRNRLTESRLIDFDDMLTYTYELFRERPDILSAWQKKYVYILIDEFQDINPIQWEIMKMLAAPQNNLFVVGDDDQAIYRFRGAKPEIMLGFGKDYPDAKMVNLAVNYRCPPPVVEAAGRLIAHNEARYEKQIRAAKDGREPVRFVQFEDQQRENAFLIGEIAKARAAGEELSRIAVLFRTNMQPRFLMEQLVSVNLPFTAKDRIPNIYDHWIARDLFAYLRIAQGSDKRADFLSILNKPNRYISRSSLAEAHIDFETWMGQYDEQPWIAERIEKLWYDMKQLGRLSSPYAAINFIRKGIGYDDYLTDYAEYRGVSAEDLYEMADEILSSAKGFSTLEEWYDHIEEYRTELKRQEKKRDGQREGVTLATLHSAKGLEFERVYLIDACEGVMPYKKAQLQPDIEEERRLFYVGMTRASRELTICSVKNFHNHEMNPSRFIREAGYDRE
jgi:DNA helicase-2/ATP-dependent DNA helicase PcrA